MTHDQTMHFLADLVVDAYRRYEASYVRSPERRLGRYQRDRSSCIDEVLAERAPAAPDSLKALMSFLVWSGEGTDWALDTLGRD